MASERPEVSEYFATLHSAVFKPRGYSKLRRTFEKEYEGYAVAFQFQGSDWNDASRAWRFYLNTGIRFPDLPRRDPDRDFPTIHAWTRVRAAISEMAEPQYEISDENLESQIQKMAIIVEDCISYFSANHGLIHTRYELRPVSQLVYLDESLLQK